MSVLDMDLKGGKNQFRKHSKRMKVGGLQYQLLKHRSTIIL